MFIEFIFFYCVLIFYTKSLYKNLYICNLEVEAIKVQIFVSELINSLGKYKIKGRCEFLMRKILFVNKKNVKEKSPIKFSGIIVFLLKQNSTQKQNNVEKANQQFELYELYKDLNPRYFEILSPLKEAKLKIESSDILYSSQSNFLTPF